MGGTLRSEDNDKLSEGRATFHRIGAVLLICSSVGVLLHSIVLMFHVTNTDIARYKEDVGKVLFVVGLMMLVAALTGALKGRSRHLGSRNTAVGALALALLLGIGGEVWTFAKMHPAGPEHRVIDSFVPPPGSTPIRENDSASYFPTAGRHWRLSTTSVEEAQGAGRQALEEWADPGTVRLESANVPSRFLAEKGDHVVLMRIVKVRNSNELSA